MKGYHHEDLQEHATKMRVRGTEPTRAANEIPGEIPVASSPSLAAIARAAMEAPAIEAAEGELLRDPALDDLLADLMRI